MKIIRYRYMKADGSLDAVASRFLTTADVIRRLTLNAGKEAHIAFAIDDPKWGTREIDYGRTILVPLPVDDPKQQDKSDVAADRIWTSHVIGAQAMFVTFYRGVDRTEKREPPYVLGEDPAVAKAILNNWRNRDFRRSALERNQDPSFGRADAARTVWLPGPLVVAERDCTVWCAPSWTATGAGNTYRTRFEIPAAFLPDDKIATEYQNALDADDHARQAEIEDEVCRRLENWGGTALPRGTWPGNPANVGVTPEVALKILDNMSQNDYGWRPEEGAVGRAAWFTTSGNPYVGKATDRTVKLEVEIDATRPRIKVDEPMLQKIFQRKLGEAEGIIRSQIKERFKVSGDSPLVGRALKEFKRQIKYSLDKFAERMMWEEVGKMASDNPKSVVEVEIRQGRFSTQGSGKFEVVGDRAAVRVRGGPGSVVAALDAAGVKAEAPLMEAAEAAAKRLKWAGRVRGVFRYGGKILIVVGIALDVYKIYHAKDHLKAVVESAGGWAGATAAGAAFAAWWTPADVAGPWAWLGHGVGTLIAGGIGYWVGSNTTRLIYEFVVEEEEAPDEMAYPGDEILPSW